MAVHGVAAGRGGGGATAEGGPDCCRGAVRPRAVCDWTVLGPGAGCGWLPVPAVTTPPQQWRIVGGGDAPRDLVVELGEGGCPGGTGGRSLCLDQARSGLSCTLWLLHHLTAREQSREAHSLTVKSQPGWIPAELRERER